MFKESLQTVVDGTEGGLAGLLMDFEGIPLESYERAEGGGEIEVVGAEVSVVVKAIQRATQNLGSGETREVSFQADGVMTLIRIINETYFVAVTMKPDANVGKARYLLRLAAPKLREELS